MFGVSLDVGQLHEPINSSSSITWTHSNLLHPVVWGLYQDMQQWCFTQWKPADARCFFKEPVKDEKRSFIPNWACKLQRLRSIRRREQRPSLHPLISDLVKWTSCFPDRLQEEATCVSTSVPERIRKARSGMEGRGGLWLSTSKSQQEKWVC